MSIRLRTLGGPTVKALGFFTWCASCSWLFREYCYDWASSAGPSMYPTLGVETKYIVLSKRHRLGRNLKVGDLIHFKHPNFRNQNAGKRVIGLPGDFVVRDPHMAPTVGGMAVRGDRGAQEKRAEPEMIEVPPGHVWVAGDNLSWSRDSRFYGPVPMGLVLGKVVRHSNPSSDWIIDMVNTSRDQLRPAWVRDAGLGSDDWNLAEGAWRRLEKPQETTHIGLPEGGA